MFSSNLHVLLLQTATKFLGHNYSKLCGPNYLINENVRYFLWPMNAMKKVTEQVMRA